MKRPVPEEQYPQVIRGIGYIPFFEIDREKGQDEPYFKGYASTAPSDKYWDAIREVAKNLQQFFAEMADRAAAQQRQQAATATRGATVYLAHPSNDLSDACWSFRKELEAQGCEVVPREPWPDNPAAAEQHLRDALARAQLSIHLLGATPGSDSSGLSSLARLQLDLAAQRGAADAAFRRLIWLPDRLSGADAAQTELIASLERGEGLRAQDELVRAGAEGFKDVVREELTRLAGAAARPSRVYLICDAVDEDEALQLRPRLVEAGFEVELPEFGPGGTVPADEHQRCLAGCETVLLFWGQINEARIRARIEEIDGAIVALRQGARYAARGLYLRLLPSARKANFASNYIDVMLRDPGEFKELRAKRARELARDRALGRTALSGFASVRPRRRGILLRPRGADPRAAREAEGRRLIAVVGRSGCGKSSLVRAGLVPLLLRESAADDMPNWRIATFRPQAGRCARSATRCCG